MQVFCGGGRSRTFSSRRFPGSSGFWFWSPILPHSCPVAACVFLLRHATTKHSPKEKGLKSFLPGGRTVAVHNVLFRGPEKKRLKALP